MPGKRPAAGADFKQPFQGPFLQSFYNLLQYLLVFQKVLPQRFF
jgi:hypothetical protein